MSRKLILPVLCAVCFFSPVLVACQVSPPLSPEVQSKAQPRLVGPLSQALDFALKASQQSRTPEEARQKSQQAFYSEFSRLLQRTLSQKDVQFQAQSQWTASGLIQIQLQVQISEQTITAQAQRQSQFAPQP
ncbi:hypothetical protein COW36_12225 [bacterium (Candidatus Blackallbacteria) CG17_big_fil_post_rev_8_21_14_2_50_48_46]|uniref:Uncharacterized protein n=1 Tax=bacterium (Candidatus Blackallbacteria) CG17_big_fil_post_rev_8_21_14_2_50_48_46 TaxID=2014261 RepID=A0A2M7G3S4_9BACT|nr:MAG: hypothetical protein COW64_03035 [bacterium (Candidatus Blackallbacteria) CG18_big_fil_WC_8_21_14_2_50_49_26]PIW16526.1 MAG: hypothetical protein COW36_12225 [bacterium (Candidatus Blackallbacteria) CG17_big_fil_post_rev_8_21_14_2_50_48_46]PIW46034.1 MAG: hypothetical protein COW20_17490 [bacterium (Candidatus Blackallbacteria) CG13_big_fil_rev_8_21_14_2_50_49_14]